MSEPTIGLNSEVTKFLDGLQHPFRNEIEALRRVVLDSAIGLNENIKWNGPNYSVDGNDRITMKIQPPKQVQIIFHRGAKVQPQPKEKLVRDSSGILTWKGNDRAVATFKNMADIEKSNDALVAIIKDWIHASK